MRTPSRRMPAASVPPKPGIGAWAFLVAFAGCVGWAASLSEKAAWTVGAFVLLFGFLCGLGWLRTRRVNAERTGESICSFARALPARQYETWVVRAVYEELSRATRCPVRPGDRLENDLALDPDDWGETAIEAARRAGRSLENAAANPFYDKVATVRDLVRFLDAQPRLR